MIPHHLDSISICSHAARAIPRVVTFATLLLASATWPVSAAEIGSLKQITGPSPFSSCVADQVGSQVGTNYPQSEIEPWIDTNPTDRRNLIAGWQQDRWSNGGSRGALQWRIGRSATDPTTGGRSPSTTAVGAVTVATPSISSRRTAPVDG